MTTLIRLFLAVGFFLWGVGLLSVLWEWAADPLWDRNTLLWIAWQASPFALIAACVGFGGVPISRGGLVLAGTSALWVVLYAWIWWAADPFIFWILGPVPLVLLAAVSGALALSTNSPAEKA